MRTELPKEASITEITTLRIRKLGGNTRLNKPEIFIFQTVQVDTPQSDEDIAQEMYRKFFVYLPWEIRRAIGKYLVSAHPEDPS